MAETATLDSQTSRMRASAVWKSYAVFTVCASLFLLPFMMPMIVGSDEGSLLCGAERIVHGQVFARDFFEVMGPGTFYWLAAFFKVFGTTFVAARICLFVSSLGAALAIFFLSRQVCPKYQILPCIILAGVYSGTWPQISHHLDSDFFGLLSVVCMVLWNGKRTIGWLIGAGMLAGITACVLQPKGVLLLGAFLIWLWLRRRENPAAHSSPVIISASFLSVIVIVLAYFWSRGALRSLVYVDYFYPLQHYSSVNKVAYAQGIITQYWNGWIGLAGGSNWSIALAVILIIPFALVSAIVPLLLVLAFRYQRASFTSVVLLCCLAGFAMWAAELHRVDMYHLVYASPLLVILFTHALGERRDRIYDLGAQSLAISASCLMAFNLLWVAAGSHRVTTRVGTVYVMGIDPVLNFLIKDLPPGAETLIYPYCPIYYFLAGVPNPTRYSFLVYGYNIPSQFQEVVKILENRRVKYVVWDTTYIARFSRDILPGSQPQKPEDYILEPYLESHYKSVQNFNGVEVLERTDP